jgi:ATP-dependent Clp protease ATP-binding subunit ClpA
MARRNKSNVLIVGDPGVGKTAIVEGLARRIAKNKADVPEYLKDHIVFSLDISVCWQEVNSEEILKRD